MSNKLVELKRCPFCGCEATRKYNEFSKLHYICCDNVNCLVTVRSHGYQRQCDATKAWNKRVVK